MAMVKGKRRKIFNMIEAAFKAQPKYKVVALQLPDAATFPNSQSCPGIYIARALDPVEAMTACEHESRLSFDIYGVIHEPGDITTALCDLQDDIEETLMSLQHDNDFLAIATLIAVTQADPTPLVLALLGIGNAILPPFGIVKVSGHVLFHYEAF